MSAENEKVVVLGASVPDTPTVFADVPVNLTAFEDWAAQQNWTV